MSEVEGLKRHQEAYSRLLHGRVTSDMDVRAHRKTGNEIKILVNQ